MAQPSDLEPIFDDDPNSDPYGPELVFGIVAPIGIDTEAVRDSVTSALKRFNYQVIPITVSKLLDAALGHDPFVAKHEDARVEHYIKSGNELCSKTQREDAAIGPALAEVKIKRAEISPNGGPALRKAYVFSSLKRPAEVEALRGIYGRYFYLIGAQAPLKERRTRLFSQISQTRSNEQSAWSKTDELISLDRKQTNEAFGQNVLQTFPLADLFVDVSIDDEPQHSVNRLINLIFHERHDPLGTPTLAEHALALALTTSLRSSSLSRRVGAVLCDDVGAVLAAGCNEVPKARGGHYWPGEKGDARDVKRRVDYSKLRIREVAMDFVNELAGEHFSAKSAAKLKEDPDQFVQGLLDGSLSNSRLKEVVEYHRAVHGEESALAYAARRGVSTAGSTLYCTTFPCHLCTRKLVASGVEAVVYIEPYPKSLADAMYNDSVSTEGDVSEGEQDSRIPFRPFVGISPARFNELFASGRSLSPNGPEAERVPIGSNEWAFAPIATREDQIITELAGEPDGN